MLNSLPMVTSSRAIYLYLFVLGTYIRLINVWQPLDGSLRESWREADVASIARNYYREGMNIFYPRIDWRGDGPGYAEMEFPALPWLMAASYKVFGYHESNGKIISFSFSLAAMLIFFFLAHRLLPIVGALSAGLFFALNPLLFRLANTLQPESIMFMFYILAGYAFIRWIESNSWKYFLIALGATTCMLLAKISAAHMGVFFLLLIGYSKGIKFLKNPLIWVFGVLSLLPAMLWYSHAHNLWHQYGNSLGVSNEYHWVGWDFFTNPYFIKGILLSEIRFIVMPTGLIIILLGLFMNKLSRANLTGLMWLISIFIFYFLTARTSADGWAYYYHIFSIPPAAILWGSSVAAIHSVLSKERVILGIIFCTIIAGLIITVDSASTFDHVTTIMITIWLGLTFFFTFFLAKQFCNWTHNNLNRYNRYLLHCLRSLLLLLIPANYFYMASRIAGDINPAKLERMQILYEFARANAPIIPKEALIICSGGICCDKDGYPVAYNASYFFFWMDRKGFSICEEEQSIAKVEALVFRGAKFFIAEKGALKKVPDFENTLKTKYLLLNECLEGYLFELRTNSPTSETIIPVNTNG